MYQIISSGRSYALRIDISWWDGSSDYAEYLNFTIGSVLTDYQLNAEDYNGTMGDVLNSIYSISTHTANHRRFSTFDADHDNAQSNCASDFTGGWWYDWCYGIYLTGFYATEGKCPSFCFGACACSCSAYCNKESMIKYATMKIRPVIS